MPSTTFQDTRLHPTPKTPRYVSRIDALENRLSKLYATLTPKIPRSVQDRLLKAAPYLAILLVTFYFPFSLVSLFASLGGLLGLDIFGFVGALSSLFGVFLVALSIPGLFKKFQGAWKLNFYAGLFTSLTLLDAGSALGFVVRFLIVITGGYLLFGLRERYRY